MNDNLNFLLQLVKFSVQTLHFLSYFFLIIEFFKFRDLIYSFDEERKERDIDFLQNKLSDPSIFLEYVINGTSRNLEY